MRSRGIITGILIAALAAGVFPAAARGWETVRSVREDAKMIVREPEVEIHAAPGVIQVSVTRPVQIKIFTILGRLVSSETLPQGMMQFKVPAHGVYIVKAGDLTCKVAV